MQFDDIFQEYDIELRRKLMNKYNLDRNQMNCLVKAYDDIAIIGGLLFRSEIEKQDIRYLVNNEYTHLPRIMYKIIEGTNKNRFNEFFSPRFFNKYFERFIKKCFSLGLRNRSDLIKSGFICYVKQPKVEVVITEYR